MDPLFLSLDEVLEIHAQQIELYGGSDGVRDPAGLESAVATPMATFVGEFLHSTIPSMAAAYLFHICQNHPFVDGNKRAGANAAITFLLINDWEPGQCSRCAAAQHQAFLSSSPGIQPGLTVASVMCAITRSPPANSPGAMKMSARS
jgi:death-on-curing protein